MKPICRGRVSNRPFTEGRSLSRDGCSLLRHYFHTNTQTHKHTNPMHIKFTVTSCTEQHCVFTVFTGYDPEHYQNAGQLTVSPNEFLLFSTGQLFAQGGMRGHYVVVFDDAIYQDFQTRRDAEDNNA